VVLVLMLVLVLVLMLVLMLLFMLMLPLRPFCCLPLICRFSETFDVHEPLEGLPVSVAQLLAVSHAIVARGGQGAHDNGVPAKKLACGDDASRLLTKQEWTQKQQQQQQDEQQQQQQDEQQQQQQQQEQHEQQQQQRVTVIEPHPLDARAAARKARQLADLGLDHGSDGSQHQRNNLWPHPGRRHAGVVAFLPRNTDLQQLSRLAAEQQGDHSGSGCCPSQEWGVATASGAERCDYANVFSGTDVASDAASDAASEAQSLERFHSALSYGDGHAGSDVFANAHSLERFHSALSCGDGHIGGGDIAMAIDRCTSDADRGLGSIELGGPELAATCTAAAAAAIDTASVSSQQPQQQQQQQHETPSRNLGPAALGSSGHCWRLERNILNDHFKGVTLYCGWQ
jgi:hypothetical protein